MHLRSILQIKEDSERAAKENRAGGDGMSLHDRYKLSREIEERKKAHKRLLQDMRAEYESSRPSSGINGGGGPNNSTVSIIYKFQSLCVWLNITSQLLFNFLFLDHLLVLVVLHHVTGHTEVSLQAALSSIEQATATLQLLPHTNAGDLTEAPSGDVRK